MTQRTIRPGPVIKSFLLANGKASQADLHRAYTDQIFAENIQRKINKEKPLSKMTYDSFRTLITRARLSGLLEVVGEEELYGSPLIGVKDNKIIPARSVILALTATGESEVGAWDNLQAYHDRMRGA